MVHQAFKKLDIFGYSVKLNVDKENQKHKTKCGTLVTLFYFILIGLIFSITINKSIQKLSSEPSERRLSGSNEIQQTIITS